MLTMRDAAVNLTYAFMSPKERRAWLDQRQWLIASMEADNYPAWLIDMVLDRFGHWSLDTDAHYLTSSTRK